MKRAFLKPKEDIHWDDLNSFANAVWDSLKAIHINMQTIHSNLLEIRSESSGNPMIPNGNTITIDASRMTTSGSYNVHLSKYY